MEPHVYVVRINDGIDWRYVGKAGFSYTLSNARTYSSEAEANAVAARLRNDEGVRAHVNQVVA